MTRATDAIERTLCDFSTSYWLKDAINALLARDALDAAIDAQHLADLFAALQHETRMHPVGTASAMPGVDAWTVTVCKAEDVPVGTQLFIKS